VGVQQGGQAPVDAAELFPAEPAIGMRVGALEAAIDEDELEPLLAIVQGERCSDSLEQFHEPQAGCLAQNGTSPKLSGQPSACAPSR
jgi:hypothetical protein